MVAPRFIVFGGGCYGSFYARQLIRAADAGTAVGEIIIVDHNESPPARQLDSPLLTFAAQDWDGFCDQYFGTLSPSASDHIVPPPFTPHLALRWLLRTVPRDRPDVSWELEPFMRLPGTPYQRQQPGGPLTLSHADWTCPVHCVEPALCPVTKGPRYWDLADTVTLWADALSDARQSVQQIHLFQCLHFTHGVGTYPAARVVAARRSLAAAQVRPGEPARFLVGTVSRCHGAINLVKAVAGTDTV